MADAAVSHTTNPELLAHAPSIGAGMRRCSGPGMDPGDPIASVFAESADFIYYPRILWFVRTLCVSDQTLFGCDVNQTCVLARRWPIYMHTDMHDAESTISWPWPGHHLNFDPRHIRTKRGSSPRPKTDKEGNVDEWRDGAFMTNNAPWVKCLRSRPSIIIIMHPELYWLANGVLRMHMGIGVASSYNETYKIVPRLYNPQHSSPHLHLRDMFCMETHHGGASHSDGQEEALPWPTR